MSGAARPIDLGGPLDLARTVGGHRVGGTDPSLRIGPGSVWRATRTPEGPGTIEIVRCDRRVVTRAWGSGADWLQDRAPAFLGLDDDPGAFCPQDPVVRELHRRHPGIRVGRTGAVVEALLPTILEQKVTTTEALRSWRGLQRRFGEAAPGPGDLQLRPDPARLARLSYADLHRFGIERRRAETLLGVCRRAPSLERLTDRSPDGFRAALESLRGIGPWTSNIVAERALGDPDAVAVGDYHLPSLVAFALAGERQADDARMLELLEPFRGHRARVMRLLMAQGRHPPRRAPRARLRSFADF